MMDLRLLALRWIIASDGLSARSSETYRQLETGELPQDDAIIYSVYEDEASATTLRGAAIELLEALDKITK